MTFSQGFLDTEATHLAHNYAPLPVVLARGEGSWVYDVDGRAYLDFLAGYSALNFGHQNPRLIAAARHQLETLTLTSRAFRSDRLAPFAKALTALCGKESMLPMNTGAEAVETAIKIARKWGYVRKGVGHDRAKIIVSDGNFHGRTTTIVSFSSDEDARTGFGPYTPGFVSIPFGDAAALEAAIDEDTVAFVLEPIQGEAGVILPPDGWLRDVRRICSDNEVLMIADEIQSGLGRSGATFACDLEDVTPDVYILGKALGGGILPVSAVVANWDIMSVLSPGQHGSTFGGNPLGAAVGLEVVEILGEGEIQARTVELGRIFADGLASIAAESRAIADIRVRGLWAGVDIAAGGPTGKEVTTRLASNGVLAKETHGRTIRFSPPLTISGGDLALGLERIAQSLA
ncbi:MAG TPA: ornithine--oxo-acid transaminase [Acidimicrobiia bacterium]|nr:ornithine--oxo-acid transaminase [Acidimicrobiia bacterium]